MFKSKWTYVLSSILLIFIFSFIIKYNLNANQEGISAGYSGSNYDGRSCATASCHNAPVYIRDGSLSSNIPSNGFVGDSIYTITASLKVANCSIYGFQASPQYDIGHAGGILITDSNRTLSLMGDLYIIHRLGGSIGQDSISWSFDWQAPDTNIDVTIHSCFVAGHDTATDSCYYDSIILHPFINSIKEDVDKKYIIYPNPASNFIILDKEYSKIEFYTLDGSLIYTQQDYSRIIDIGILKNSYYIVKIYCKNEIQSYKLLKI